MVHKMGCHSVHSGIYRYVCQRACIVRFGGSSHDALRGYNQFSHHLQFFLGFITDRHVDSVCNCARNTNRNVFWVLALYQTASDGIVWCLPPRLCPSRPGEFSYRFWTYRKWSLIDLYVLVMSMIAFFVEGSNPDEIIFPEGFYDVNLWVTPVWGLYAFCFASLDHLCFLMCR